MCRRSQELIPVTAFPCPFKTCPFRTGRLLGLLAAFSEPLFQTTLQATPHYFGSAESDGEPAVYPVFHLAV